MNNVFCADDFKKYTLILSLYIDKLWSNALILENLPPPAASASSPFYQERERMSPPDWEHWAGTSTQSASSVRWWIGELGIIMNFFNFSLISLIFRIATKILTPKSLGQSVILWITNLTVLTAVMRESGEIELLINYVMSLYDVLLKHCRTSGPESVCGKNLNFTGLDSKKLHLFIHNHKSCW